MRKVRSGKPPVESNYARKKRLQGEGEEPTGASERVSVESDVILKDTRQCSTVNNVVKAIVVLARWVDGYLVAETDEGVRLFMGANKVKNSPFNHKVSCGTWITCTHEPHPNGKGPRVVKILKVISTT